MFENSIGRATIQVKAVESVLFTNFHDERIPLYLLTVFGKGEKDNLSQAERNALAKLVRLLVQAWKIDNE